MAIKKTKNPFFTEEELELMKKLYTEGYSSTEIAGELTTTSTTILKYLRKSGVTIKEKSKPRFTEEQAKLMKDLYIDKGYSRYRIAKELYTDPNTVLRYLKKAGITIKIGEKQKKKPKWTEEDAKLMKELYTVKGHSSIEIATMFKSSPKTVLNCLRKAGTTIRPSTNGIKSRRKTRLTEKEVELMKELHAVKKYGFDKIAEKLGAYPRTIIRYLTGDSVPIVKPEEKKGIKPFFSEEELELMKELYTIERCSSHKIAEILSVAPSTVLKYLRKMGVTVDTKRYRKHKFTEEEVRSMGELYRRRRSSTEIAKRFSTTPNTVLKCVRRVRVTIRSGKPHKRLKPFFSKNELKLMEDLYTIEEYSAEKIAYIMNVSRPTVIKYLKAEDVPIRSGWNERRKPRFTEEKCKLMKELYVEKGYSSIQIARMLSTSQPTVLKCLRRVGVIIKPKLNSRQIEEIKELREQGWTLKKIATKYGLSSSRIRQILLKSKGEILSYTRWERRDKVEQEEILGKRKIRESIVQQMLLKTGKLREDIFEELAVNY